MANLEVTPGTYEVINCAITKTTDKDIKKASKETLLEKISDTTVKARESVGSTADEKRQKRGGKTTLTRTIGTALGSDIDLTAKESALVHSIKKEKHEKE